MNRDFVMDPFKKLPLEIALKILALIPVESIRHCRSMCTSLRNAVDVHFNDHFKKLLYKIRLDILSRLPAEVLYCKLVCRNWRKIVGVVSKDPEFIQKHLYRLNHPSAAEDSCKLGFLALSENLFYYFEFDDDQNHELTEQVEERQINTTEIGGGGCLFVGSCNGLICLARKETERPICVYNPLTKEYVVLPEIIDPYVNSYEFDDWSFGFGYVSATNEYKVVGIYESKSNFLEVYIYTIGSGNGWRDLGRNFNLEFSPSSHVGSFANEAVYWIGGVVNKIVTFDFIEEKFCQHVAPPPLPPNEELVHQTIGVLDGLLYIAIYDQGDELFDIWVLKSKNDNHVEKKGEKHQLLGWSKELRVDEDGLLAVTKSGGVLTYNNNDQYVNLYDTKASASEILWDMDYKVQQVFPHKNTFVSLKELGEEDTGYISN